MKDEQTCYSYKYYWYLWVVDEGPILMVRWLVTRGDKAQTLDDGLQ